MYKQLAWLLVGTLIGKYATAPKCKEIVSKSAQKAAGIATQSADYFKKKAESSKKERQRKEILFRKFSY
jgi:hypothetical protein